MSEELEAVEARQALHMIERSVGEHGWFGCEEVETLETAINELEDLRHKYKAIEEALKRNEPMKPTLDENNNHRCARCHHIVDNHYCSDCGGAVDWSSSNE